MPSSEPKRLVLCILDGWGIAPDSETNAINLQAKHWAELLKKYPWTTLQASEDKVGLPEGQMGNSEVGHMSIGLGRVIVQDLPRINQAIRERTLKDNSQLQEFINRLRQSKGICHLMGLLSPGGVHSHQDHFFSLLKIFKAEKIPVKIHAFLDGRDTSPKCALQSIEALQPHLNHSVELVSLSGRYYAMDRDNRWERTQQAYDTISEGQSQHFFKNAFEAINFFYDKGITDEFIPPALLETAEQPFQKIKDGDGLLMVNFRADRVRQLLEAFLVPDLSSINRSRVIKWSAVLGMTEYSSALNPFIPAMFPRIPLNNSLGEIIAKNGHSQLRIAETEKYAHVTFFFNGGREHPFELEDRILIPSPSVATYDQCPEMSAPAITDEVLKVMKQDKYQLIVINYANADMVGHTGCLKATREAIEVLDQSLKKLEQSALKNNWYLIVTADHGNAEKMQDNHAHPHTAHTCNPVPFMLIGHHNLQELSSGGALCDIAPTVLELLGYNLPAEMTGRTLLVKK
jgi:2,3-bisphosphoglycerate-independent phosphoglycerate mutase